MRNSRHWVKGAVLMTIAAVTANDAWSADVRPIQLTTTCRSCHGDTGNSVSTPIPRLNGQKAAYIVDRIKILFVPGGQGPHTITALSGDARDVDDATLRAIANYFASQNPTQARSAGALVDEGRKLYSNGNLAERVPPCQQCHGAHAEGDGSTPRLAGQHGEYLQGQLERFRSGKQGPDFMHNITNNLSDYEIKALRSYLAND